MTSYPALAPQSEGLLQLWMPEEYDEFMIYCDVCHQWFHTSCVNLKGDSFTNQWKCYTCGK